MQRKPKLVVLFNKQAGRCAFSGESMTLDLGKPNTATIDHVIPKSVIGRLLPNYNEVAVCYWVNQAKKDRPLADFIGIMARRQSAEVIDIFTREPVQ